MTPKILRRYIVIVAIQICVFSAFSSVARAQKRNRIPQPTEVAKKALISLVLIIATNAEGEEEAFGTGFFVYHNLIATNYHVIEGARKLLVRKVIGGNSHAEASVRWVDIERDLAVLRVSKLTGIPLPLAEHSNLEIGSTIYVAGNPKGFEGTFSNGIVSGFRKAAVRGRYIQITSPISPGSSGGPVLNQYGEVIGVATLTYEDGQNLNFAIPVEPLSFLTEVAITEEKDHRQENTKPPVNNQPKVNSAGMEDNPKPQNKGAAETQQDYFIRLGIAYAYKEEHQYAITLFKKALGFDSENAKAYFYMGRSYLSLKDYSSGLAYIGRATRLEPNNAQYHFILGLESAYRNLEDETIKECNVLKNLDYKSYKILADTVCERFHSIRARDFCLSR